MLPRNRFQGRKARYSYHIAILNLLPLLWLIFRDESFVPHLQENHKYAKVLISPFVPGTMFQRKGREKRRKEEDEGREKRMNRRNR